jgi:hypothetical protein
MKITKWVKWQVGAVLTLSIALFFQIVKTNPQFELHTANAASGKDQPSNAIQPSDDPVIEEWNLNQDESSQQQSPRFSSNRGGRDQEGSSGRSNLRLHSQDNGSDTQTGQS